MSIFTPLFISFLLSICAVYSQPLTVSVNAEAAILMNADTGAILFQKNAHKRMFPASVTKIATALYALQSEAVRLDDIVTIPQDAVASTTVQAKRKSNYSLPAYWLEPDAGHMGLKIGEQISFKDLLYGMLIVSANDAANSIAMQVSGTVPEFMNQLNDYLKSIGCQNTQFYNPNGLYHPKHQTTAYDLAVMTKEALKNPTFCQVVSTVQYPRAKTNKQETEITLVQTNKLLRPGKFFYPKAIGVKTGYISAAGHTYVSAARDNGRTLIAVLLKTKERNEMFTDATKLFEAAFNQTKVERTLVRAGPQKSTLKLRGAASPVKAYLKENLAISYYPAEEPQVKCLLYWDEVKPPIAKNQTIGKLQVVTDEGTLLAMAPLLAQEDVKATWWYTLTHLWKTHPALSVVLFLVIFFVVFLTLGRFLRR